MFTLLLCVVQRLRVQKEVDSEPHDAAYLMREKIIRRAAVEFQDGMYGILGS
jgi:3-oxoacid CoA-transferase